MQKPTKLVYKYIKVAMWECVDFEIPVCYPGGCVQVHEPEAQWIFRAKCRDLDVLWMVVKIMKKLWRNYLMNLG